MCYCFRRKRKRTYKSIYCDIGTALGAFSTSELAEYYIQRFGDSALRYFLKQGIIAAELEQIKAEKEKDVLLTEESKKIYRKLYIIYIYKSDLKTFKGLIIIKLIKSF